MVIEEPEGKKRRRRRRKRRKDDPDRMGFAALLPQLLTTANLAAGFFAIVTASGGELMVASYAIFVAAVFDILDGRAARMTGNVSRFGAEYDSIADTVSFGVAPAVLAFHAGSFVSLGWAGWVMAFVYTACASMRTVPLRSERLAFAAAPPRRCRPRLRLGPARLLLELPRPPLLRPLRPSPGSALPRSLPRTGRLLPRPPLQLHLAG